MYRSQMNACIARPCLWTLPSTLKTLYLDDLNHDNESQRQAAFQLITDAAQRADNVGVDEFPSLDWLDLMLHYTDVAVLMYEPRDEETRRQRLMGLIVVAESRFTRTARPTSCQLFVVTAAELSGRQVRRDLARLGVALAADSKPRYIDCFVEVFVPCLEHVLAMRDEGFVVTACIPTAGILAGQTGHVDSYVMYKQLHIFDVHCLPMTLSLKEDDDDDVDVKLEDLSFTLRPLPDYLPCRCNIDGGRTQITVRPLRRDEVGDFYATMKEAAASGNGYGFDELPGLAYFVRWFVHDKYNLVYELATPQAGSDKSSNTEAVRKKSVVIGYNNFGPSLYTRNHDKAALFDGNMILRSEFRGRRWSGDLSEIRIGIGVDCGVHSFFEESFITNLPATRSLRRMGANVCGTVPRNSYVCNCGFVDSVLFYKPLDEGHSFRLANRIVQSTI